MATTISVLAELERARHDYAWVSDSEIKTHCPFHQDDSPSCNVNVKEGVFKCHAATCGRAGDIVTLLCGVYKAPRATIMEDLATRYEIADVKIVEPAAVERWHDAIWSAPGLLAELRKRAVTDAMIKRYKYGEDRGRITIPIPNAAGDWVNVRRYLPGAPGAEKMKNMRGRGSARWYPIEQLCYDAIMLCGGELKSIVAAEQLNPHGVGAICVTMGEKLIPPEMLRQLGGKVAYVCMDVDTGGRKASENNCRALRSLAAELYEVLLPLNLEQYPKGDVNDFVAAGGDMWMLIQSLDAQWEPPTSGSTSNSEPESLHLVAAANAKYAGRRVRVTGVVSMMDVAPYVLPRNVVVKCDRSQPFCSICPQFTSPSGEFTIEPENSALLEMVATAKANIRQAVMNGVGVPSACKVCEIEVTSHYNAEDVRLAPQLEITNRASDRAIQPAVCIGEGLELNEAYSLTGRMWPNPKTQQSTLLISGYAPTKDALTTYVPHDLESLRAFRPREWSVDALAEKLDEIYDDLEANVTRIWRRRPMHITVDLAYHSPLFIGMDDQVIKGWTEVLVLGDTAQGKSEVACGSGRPGGLMNHYNLGVKVECKNATAAGLLGGLQQAGNGRYMVSWGIIPTHDKRLVILEELKGLPVEAFAKLTDMRSSGVAELPKIERRKTHARTRIVATSNPRSQRPLRAYGFGIEAMQELIGNPEDLRRFDLAIIVAEGEVDPSEINRLRDDRPKVEHRFDGDLCRALILWVWTRDVAQVIIPQDTVRVIIDAACRLTDKYTDSVPLIDRGSIRYKIARLAASLAGRTFSTDDAMERLVVRPCHVEYIERFVDAEYSKPSVGYKRYSEALRAVSTILEPEAVKRLVATTPYPKDIANAILCAETMELQDVQDWCSWDFVDARALVSSLVRKHALIRDGRVYRKTGAFVELLRRALKASEFGDRPAHITEGNKKEEF